MLISRVHRPWIALLLSVSMVIAPMRAAAAASIGAGGSCGGGSAGMCSCAGCGDSCGACGGQDVPAPDEAIRGGPCCELMATLATTGDDRGCEPATGSSNTGATSAGSVEDGSPQIAAVGQTASGRAIRVNCAVVACCESCDCDASSPVSIPPSVQIRVAIVLFDGGGDESMHAWSAAPRIARGGAFASGALRCREMRATSPPIRVMTGVRVI